MVEWKLFPRLEADQLIAADLELNSTLLTTKTTMRLHQTLSGVARLVLPSPRRGVGWVRTKTIEERFRRGRWLSHETPPRSEEHTSELQSHSDLVCRLLLEKKKKSGTNWSIF